MQVTVNGHARDVEMGTSVTALLEQLGLSAQQVAVEVNLELVPRPRHAEHVLQEGDQVEVVTLVGGG